MFSFRELILATSVCPQIQYLCCFRAPLSILSILFWTFADVCKTCLMWQLIFTWKLKIKYIARSVLCPAPVPAKPDIAAIFHILSRRLQLVDSQQSARKSNNSPQIFLIFYLKSEVRISEMWTILNNINTVQYWLFTVEKEKTLFCFQQFWQCASVEEATLIHWQNQL